MQQPTIPFRPPPTAHVALRALGLFLALAPAVARAAGAEKADANPKADSFAAVAPYVGPAAVGVARADLTRVDLKAIEAWVADMAKVAGMREKERTELM